MQRQQPPAVKFMHEQALTSVIGRLHSSEGLTVQCSGSWLQNTLQMGTLLAREAGDHVNNT